MSVSLAWTIFSCIGFFVALIGAYYARFEYLDTREELLVTRARSTRIIARDQLRQRRATYLRLIIFALVMLTYAAVGGVAMSLPPPRNEDFAVLRSLLGILLIGGEVLLVVAKSLDLYTLYQQRLTRRLWAKVYETERQEEE